MAEAKAVNMPFAQHFKLSSNQSPTNEESRKEMSNIPFTSAVSSLMYSMVCTRPDLAYAMSVVSRFMKIQARHIEMQLSGCSGMLKGLAAWYCPMVEKYR